MSLKNRKFYGIGELGGKIQQQNHVAGVISNFGWASGQTSRFLLVEKYWYFS
jgi:hypothetical protein